MSKAKPHYLRLEKEVFFRWLLSDRKLNEKDGTKVVKILAAIEKYAKERNFENKVIFSDKVLEVLLTLKEFIGDSVFKSFSEKYANNRITAEEAIGVFVTFKMSSLGIENNSGEWTADSTLYVHRGKIFCQKENHYIVPATAVLLGKSEQDVRLSVNYCKDCQKFFIAEESYKIYRKKYGILIGDIRFEKNGKIYIGENFLAEQSPLMLCGYTVSQQAGLTETERHYIISKMIDEGHFPKSEVIRYLEYFIKRNGQKQSNQIALMKWKCDLAFTLSYNIKRQEEHLITSIRKYKKKFKIDEPTINIKPLL